MSNDLELPSDFDPPTSERMDKPGWYHFIVEEVDEYPQGKDGQSLDGVSIELQVLEGTVRTKGISTEIGKRTSQMLFAPNGSEFDEKSIIKRYRFAVATGLVDDTEARRRKAAGEQGLPINWADAKARQFIGRVYIQNGFARLTEDIYPLGHPKVVHVPIDKATAEDGGAFQQVPSQQVERSATAAPATSGASDKATFANLR